MIVLPLFPGLSQRMPKLPQLTVHALCFSIVPVETNAQCLLNSSNTGSFSSDVLSISFTPFHTSIVKQMAREKGL